jgi:hypothetical protein
MANSIYTQEIADEILVRLAEGESLRAICRDLHMPDKATVLRWLQSNEEFRDQYARARELQAEGQADELLDIADDGTNDWVNRETRDGGTIRVLDGEHVQRSKLRVDARKWIAARLLPKRYGDRIAHEHSGSGGGPIEITTEHRSKLIAALALVLIDVAGKGDQGAGALNDELQGRLASLSHEPTKDAGP